VTYGWLQELLGELSSQAFFGEVFGKDWFHRKARVCPSPLDDLVTLRDLELLLFDGNRREEFFHAVGGQATSPGQEDTPSHHCSADEALDEWAAGKTLIFNGIDRQLPAVHALARSLEGELKCRVWCNLYLTPAQGHGFETHYDSHDVFVLQLIGSKRWRLGTSAADSPMPFQMHGRMPGIRDGHSQVEMRTGDVLYVPRGLLHDAAAEDDLSCHLTIGIHPKTYLDVILTAVTIAADRDPEFRRNLPLGSFAIGRDTIAEARRLMDLISEEDFQDAGDAFCELLASQRRRSTIDLLFLHGKSGQLSESDYFRAGPYLMSTLSHVGEAIELHAMGKSITFPLSATDDIELCCSGKVFRLSDLRGQPSLESAVLFVRRLIFEGIVQRLSPKDDHRASPVDLIKHSQPDNAMR
jgi:hypothetical protein